MRRCVSRRFALRDTWKVRKLQQHMMVFDLQRLLLDPVVPWQAALANVLLQGHAGAVTLVRDKPGSDGQLDGFIGAYPRHHSRDWDLAFLAPALDYEQHAPLCWSELLTNLTIYAAQCGAQRLSARLAEDAEAEDLLRRAGYSVVVREEVFALACRPGPAAVPKGLRRIEPRDAPSLRALYRDAIPPLVQQTDRVPPVWQLARGPTFSAVTGDIDYIWSDKGKALAHLMVRSGLHGYWLDVIVRPEYRADLLPCIKFVLTLTDCSEVQPIYCPVADYNVGLSWPLRSLGFVPYTRQVTMVAHTMARVPFRHLALVPGLEHSVDIGTPVRTIERAESHPDPFSCP